MNKISRSDYEKLQEWSVAFEKTYLNMLLTGGIGFDLNKISKEK